MPPSPAPTLGVRALPRGRFLAVHLFAFRLERCGYGANELAALLAELRNTSRLVALTPAAQAQGLHPEMTASEARARVPELAIEPLDPVGEANDLTELLRRFGGLSDHCSLHPAHPPPASDPSRPVNLVLEVHRTAHLFGGEPGLLRQALDLAEQLGHRAQLAIADHPAAAVAIASHGGRSLTPPGQGAQALAPLPLSALRWPTPHAKRADTDRVFSQLRAVGLRTLGQLAALDPGSVAGRMGSTGVLLHQIARGAGITLGTRPFNEPQPLVVAQDFPEPISTLAPVHFALPGLLHQLGALLAGRDQAAVQLCLRFELDGAAAFSVWVRSGRPTRNVERLGALVRQRLECVQLSAPATALQIEVIEAVPDPGWQPGLTDRAEGTKPLPELYARLRDAFGPNAVFHPTLRDHWRPEAAWGPSPILFGSQPLLRVPSLPDDPVLQQERWERALPRPRPPSLLPKPVPIEVCCKQAHPVRLHLARGWAQVQRAEGPERLQGGWWSLSPFVRDYWRLWLAGQVAWVYLEHGRWFLHGWF